MTEHNDRRGKRPFVMTPQGPVDRDDWYSLQPYQRKLIERLGQAPQNLADDGNDGEPDEQDQ